LFVELNTWLKYMLEMCSICSFHNSYPTHVRELHYSACMDLVLNIFFYCITDQYISRCIPGKCSSRDHQE